MASEDNPRPQWTRLDGYKRWKDAQKMRDYQHLGKGAKSERKRSSNEEVTLINVIPDFGSFFSQNH